MKDPFCSTEGDLEIILPVLLRVQTGKLWSRERQDFPEAVEQAGPYPTILFPIPFNKL